MSENYEPFSPSEPAAATSDGSPRLDATKQEASELKDTAVGQAKDVAETVKGEASAVMGEAKTQAKDLFAQTQAELTEQANTQQQRVAAGLKAVSSELESMASNSENAGVATDLVQQLSGRVSAVATWLGDRDPGSVLTEVKRYARRKPGTFIAAAAIAGVAVGRLTRALAANASDAKSGVGVAPASAPSYPASEPASPATPQTSAGVIADEETPLYAQSSAARGEQFSEGGRDVRSDSF